MNNALNIFASFLLSTTLLFCANTVGNAQEKNSIQKAMEDELARSMTDLKLDTLAKPFYISYSLNDVKSLTIVGTLGAVLNSYEVPYRGKGTRILVGDYEFNDESLDNNLFSQPEANDIELPLDNDYLGIRRAFWVTTDNVYKNAARQFAKNKADLQQQTKPLDQVPHRSFAKTPVVSFQEELQEEKVDKQAWEKIIRRLSALFIDHTIHTSSVLLNVSQGTLYFVNSEGSSIKTPVQSATLTFFAQTKTTEGEMLFDQQSIHAKTPSALGSVHELEEQVLSFIKNMEEAKKSKSFEDDYVGPVLITGQAVADIFANALFYGRDRLIADTSVPSLSGNRIDRNTGLETKIGKNVTSPLLTVKALGNKKEYEGETLFGSYAVDSEGVVPPTELVLIEKGTLQHQLTSRTLTTSTQIANGHADGPGVVAVTVEGSLKDKELTQKLLAEAKTNGLDYALIVRNSTGRTGMFNVYKVSVKDGTEEFLRNARFSSFSFRELKKIIAASQEVQVRHVTSSNGATSYLVPKAVLFSEMDVQGAEMPAFKEEEFVKSPLLKVKR